MKIRKISADILDSTTTRTTEMSPRQRKRLELESRLGDVLKRAQNDADSAFRLELEEDEKPATVRLAFKRVRDKLGTDEVNLFARDNNLFVARRPQTRGRRQRS